ncbi:PAS domain S-box protein [uncultured Pseudomonas sp.]|uniref:PAS domain S-box protein n=1 Tax=uncultured Pseudomonas sp. TaxID=114707 RepID=UPI00260FC954|nr:PAS domain S-box protein [uncultured Pseudomonas sp.]
MKKIISRHATAFSVLLPLAVGLALSILAAKWLHNSNETQALEALQQATDEKADAVFRRMRLYQYGLRGARGTIVALGEHGISRQLFSQYSQTRDLEQEFPGALGFGLIRRVLPTDEADFLQQARNDGKPDFNIRQLAPHNNERFVIQYIEPEARNLAAVGLDVSSEQNRRDAAVNALRTGTVQLSGPITLVQASGKPLQSFLIYLPIYRTGTTPETEAERLQQGFGWSYAPLLTEQVLSGLPLSTRDVDLRLRDITDPANPALFYTDNPQADQLSDSLSSTSVREVFGRRWEINLTAHPAFIHGLYQTSPRLVLSVGVLLSMLLAALSAVFGASRQHRRQVIAEQAKQAAIVESSRDGIIGKTLDGIVTSWNKGAEHIFGFNSVETVGQSLLELIVPAERINEEVNILQRINAGESIEHYETYRRRKDGSLVEVSAATAPIFDELGQVIGVSETIRDITQQKAAESEIRELNASLEKQVVARTRELNELNTLLNNVLDSASEVSIIATDTQGLITLFNHGAERLLGYSAAEMIGLQTPALIHLPEEVQQRSSELSQQYGQTIEGFQTFVHIAKTEGAEVREWRYVRKDGTQLAVTLMVTAMYGASGELVGFLGIGVDITQRKAAEAELAASLDMTQAVLDTAPNPVVTLDACGRIHTLNPAAKLAFGLDSTTAEDFLPALLSPASRQPMQALMELAAAGERDHAKVSAELIGLRSDGSEFPVQLSLGSMRADKQLLVCVITDLSQQVQLRQELITTRDQLLMAADVAELGIWSWTLADNSLQWNERMYELYQQPLALRETGLSYEHWFARIHPEDATMATEKLQAAIAGTGVYDPIFRIVRPDGSTRIIQGGAQVETDTDGNVVKMIGINRDITSQRELEASLRLAKEQADSASAAKSAFLANMSHEIRTPLNAVLGMLQLVQATPLSQRQLDYIQKAYGASQSLLGLLNDILDYSKIEAGKLQLDLQPIELEPLMCDLAVVLSGNQAQKNVEVMFDLDPALPGVLIGDSQRLQQILINLAGNALKFTAEGNVLVSLRQLARNETQVKLRVAVSDTGIGISVEQLKRIFEGFSQAETSISRRYGGTGLGLAISTRLIHMMGGELHVDSRVGEGSRFWFDLEFAIAEHTPMKAACAVVDKQLHILVVDDNPMARELLVQMSSDLDWSAEAAHDGTQALTRVREANAKGHPFDLILMDLLMPGMDGLNAARLVRDSAGDARPPLVVMVTAHGREALADSAQDADTPFAAFLTKPITPKQLASTVARVISGAPARRIAPAYQVSKRLENLRLLVVEDNQLNRQVAQELLMGEGAEVLLAEGGQQGVDMIIDSANGFDAVLMDIQMPGIDGLEATRLIRQDARFADLPIIAMTANAAPADREVCLSAGMSAHIGKPIDLEKLVDALLHWTGNTAQHSHASQEHSDAVTEHSDAVLRRFGGNLKLLRRMLGNFEPEMQKQLQQLNSHATQGDLKAVLAQLHMLKGSAGTMGAQQLAEQAANLEQKIQQLDPAAAPEFLARRGWRDALTDVLKQSVAELHLAFLAPEPAEPAEPATVTAKPTAPWQQSLHNILKLLAVGNLQAIEQTEALVHEIPRQWQRHFAKFCQAVDCLDFPNASVLGDELLNLAQED